MSTSFRFSVVSDIHYACDAEKARGSDYEQCTIANPLLRAFVRFYRQLFWAREPLNQNYLLDDFVRSAETGYAVFCGDLTCDTAFIGLADDAALQSARECLSKLRERFREGVDFVPGDHDYGKLSFFGNCGGMRLRSAEALREKLGCREFWTRSFGRYTFIGVASSLIAYPAFASEALPAERAAWEELRREHVRHIMDAFERVPPGNRVLLFCHDPTALPYLHRLEPVRRRLDQIEHTFIGHLHSKLVLAKSRLLSGMPHITFLGHTVAKLSAALREARLWRPFKVVLCPSLAGIELLKDGGYCEVEIDEAAERPAKIVTRRLPRS